MKLFLHLWVKYDPLSKDLVLVPTLAIKYFEYQKLYQYEYKIMLSIMSQWYEIIIQK